MILKILCKALIEKPSDSFDHAFLIQVLNKYDFGKKVYRLD